MGRNLPWNYRPPQPAGADVPKHRATKDRKNWCKGKEGVPHVLVWRQRLGQARCWDRGSRIGAPVESEEVCGNCGKQWLGRRVSQNLRWSSDESIYYGPAFGPDKRGRW